MFMVFAIQRDGIDSSHDSIKPLLNHSELKDSSKPFQLVHRLFQLDRTRAKEGIRISQVLIQTRKNLHRNPPYHPLNYPPYQSSHPPYFVIPQRHLPHQLRNPPSYILHHPVQNLKLPGHNLHYLSHTHVDDYKLLRDQDLVHRSH
jgi:hypothetical protein